MNRRMSPDSVTVFLFYQYDFVVHFILQGFMINAHESGSNSPGAGTFSSDLREGALTPKEVAAELPPILGVHLDKLSY